MRVWLVLVFTWLISLGMVAAEDLGRPVTDDAKTAFLTTWGTRWRGMRTLYMAFHQEKHLRMLRQPLRAQGELWLRGETLLYVLTNTKGERELAVRLDPQQLRAYYPLLHTVEEIDIQSTGALPQSLRVWQDGPEALTREYTVDLFEAAGLHTLRLVPREAHLPLQEMRLILQDFQPQEVVQIDKNGTRLRLAITAFTINPDLRETQLELHIPPGTRVTRPLP